jgi:hypothetical protein
VAQDLARLARSLEGRFGELSDGLKTLAARLEAGGPRPLAERLDAIEGRMAGQGAELANTLAGLLGDRLARTLGEVASELERFRGEREASARAHLDALAALKAAFDAEHKRNSEAAKAREEELGEIYGALLKLGTNQQTLGNNLNTWRLETSGDISIISNRLERMEKAALATTARLSNDVAVLRGRTLSRRNPLKGWLARQRPMLPGWRERAKALRRSFNLKRKGEP